MKRWKWNDLVWLATVFVLTACTAPPPPTASQAPANSSNEASNEAGRPTAFKRITAAIRDHPPSFATRRTRPDAFRGLDAIEELAHAGFSYLKLDGTRAPQLAEAVPTLDNGLWKLFPDGRMETTWKIKSNARWQDGAPHRG